MTTTATRYAAMLAQPSIVIEDDGGLSDYTLVVRRAARMLESGRVAEAEEILAEVARAVRDAKAQNGR